MRILINRTDNIGDLILSLPVVGLIKRQYPDAEIWFLARPYVKDVLNCVENIAGFVDWEQLKQLPIKTSAARLKQHNFDVFINLTTNKQTARLAFRAGIPKRVGISRKWYSWLYCNYRVNFTRRKSTLHEIQLNTKLLSALSIPTDFTTQQLLEFMPLSAPKIPIAIANSMQTGKFNLILHPGSNGHGREWPIEAYKKLIAELPIEKFAIFITGSIREFALVQPLLDVFPHVINCIEDNALHNLLARIYCADGLIAAGTGPLHLAAAFGIRALGLFPPYQPVNARRWSPIGRKAEFLQAKDKCAGKCSNRDCACMRAIEVARVKSRVLDWLVNKNVD